MDQPVETAQEMREGRPPEPGFVEAAYLTAFPDVSVAVAAGHCASAFAHFLEHGSAEGRLASRAYLGALASQETRFFPVHNIDAVLVADGGWVLVEGWLDDEVAKLESVAIVSDGELAARSTGAVRLRRTDVEAVEDIDTGQRVGFWTVLRASAAPPGSRLAVALAAGAFRRMRPADAQPVSLRGLRRRVMQLIERARSDGMSEHEIARHLATALGPVLVALNRAHSEAVGRGACCTSFGRADTPLDHSVVVLLRDPEAVFLQAALCTRPGGGVRSELVFVTDDAAILEQAEREAAASAAIYDIPIRLVALPARAGYATLIDRAVAFTRGTRLILLDEHVLGEDGGWLDAHDRAVPRQGAAEETTVLGAWLGGAAAGDGDGAERLGGDAAIAVETGLASIGARTEAVRLLRIETSDPSDRPAQPGARGRPVPAAGGRFLSVDRRVFLRLGGLSPVYWSRAEAMADFCLQAETAGLVVRRHTLPLRHLPAPSRPRTAEDAACGLLDRWMLTDRWLETVERPPGDAAG